MSDKYISSIINNCGDVDNVKDDFKTLHDILNRQGTRAFTEVLANHIGDCSIKFKLSHEENLRVLQAIIDEIKELTYERI